MKTTKKIWSVAALLGIIFLSTMSCSKEDENKQEEPKDELTITGDYYIKAKFDGAWKLNQTSSKVWCQRSYGLCYSNINGSFNDEVTLDIYREGYTYTASNIPNLEGDTIYFHDEDFRAGFHWGEDGDMWSSYNTNDPQEKSFLYIQKVEEDGSFNGFKCFQLTGTFRCVVGNMDETKTKEITDGIFSIRVSEENP